MVIDTFISSAESKFSALDPSVLCASCMSRSEMVASKWYCTTPSPWTRRGRSGTFFLSSGTNVTGEAACLLHRMTGADDRPSVAVERSIQSSSERTECQYTHHLPNDTCSVFPSAEEANEEELSEAARGRISERIASSTSESSYLNVHH